MSQDPDYSFNGWRKRWDQMAERRKPAERVTESGHWEREARDRDRKYVKRVKKQYPDQRYEDWTK